MSYDTGVSVVNNESACSSLIGDDGYTYAYSSDYYGYGAAVMIGYYGDYGAWMVNGYDGASVSFSGGTFNYLSGVKDYYYAGTYGYYPDYAGKYITNYWYGTADVQ